MTLPVVPDVPLGKLGQGPAYEASASILTASTGNDTGTAFDCTGYATVTVTLKGAAYVGTANFKGSENGTDYSNILGTLLGTTTVAATSALAGPYTGSQVWVFQVAGLTKFNVVITGSGGGSVTVTAHGDANPNAVPVGATIGTAVIQANTGQATTASGDALTAANILEAVQGRFNGATIDRKQTFTKILNLKKAAITAGTSLDALTPTAGKKFHIVAAALTNDAGKGGIHIQEVVTAATPLITIPSGTFCDDLGPGVESGAINRHIFIDVTDTGNVSGWIGYYEV